MYILYKCKINTANDIILRYWVWRQCIQPVLVDPFWFANNTKMIIEWNGMECIFSQGGGQASHPMLHVGSPAQVVTVIQYIPFNSFIFTLCNCTLYEYKCSSVILKPRNVLLLLAMSFSRASSTLMNQLGMASDREHSHNSQRCGFRTKNWAL